MQIFNKNNFNEDKIRDLFLRFGHTPDHNFDWLMDCSDRDKLHIAISQEEYVIWSYKNEEMKQYTIIGDPVAPKDLYELIILDFLDKYFIDGNSIYFGDVSEDITNIVRGVYSKNVVDDYELKWPVIDMGLFDPALPGQKFKELRNGLHKISKEHKIKVLDVNEISKDELHEVVNRWHKNRSDLGIEVIQERYHAMVDNNFRGTKSARVMLVDDKPVGFNAGWETPNNSKQWSASIGIHDYSVHDLGIALMHEDLVWIKDHGYETCNLEGSEEKALKFKTQFFTKDSFTTYKTYSFYLKNSG